MSSHTLHWETDDEYETVAASYLKKVRYQQDKKQAKHALHAAERASLTNENDQIAHFQPTYLQNFDPKHHEYRWLLESLGGFYQDRVIDDIVRMVKGGKEANVYTCTGTEATGHALLAAKLYRPRMLRHLRSDALYKEGRSAKDEAGQEIRGGRIQRALHKKTRFGQEVDFATWITHEYQMQTTLYKAGTAVPQPIAQRGNAILMAYLGDEDSAAPLLHDVRLRPAEARPLLDHLLHNVEQFLAHHAVHGDLSSYNILYWQGAATIIDFPQMVDPRLNPHALTLLERDLQRVLDYFAPYGVRHSAKALAAEMWARYWGE